MSKTQFEDLLTLVAPKIIKQTFIRESISPDQRLLLTLRYKIFINNLLIHKYIFIGSIFWLFLSIIFLSFIGSIILFLLVPS